MVQICELFADCSKYELEHAKMWYKQLYGSGSTEENLAAAVRDEHAEQHEQYAAFAQTAREEGFDEIAQLFDGVAKIAGANEERFAALLHNVQSDSVFSRDAETEWICSTCGNILRTAHVPEVCPVCDHGQAYYRIYPKNY